MIIDAVFIATGELCLKSPTGPFVAQRESGTCFRSVFLQSPGTSKRQEEPEEGERCQPFS